MVDSGDLDAKSFQNMPSKFTTKVKSLLNVFLRWVSLWEVCLKLSLLQKLAGVSLINEEISHIRIFIACTCVFACVCVWSCLGNEGRKRHEPEHAFPLRNTCAIVKLHPITIIHSSILWAACGWSMWIPCKDDRKPLDFVFEPIVKHMAWHRWRC